MTKSVVITGGNRGIGRSLTKSFVDAGFHVVVGARTSADIEALAPEHITFVEMDVRSLDGHRNLTRVANESGRTLTCYINNAGFSQWKPIDLIDDEFLSDLLDTNLKGAFWGCRAASESLGEGGTIVNISSLAGKRGSTNNAAYCASKFGMNGLTQSLAKELGPRSIRVNALCPVLIETPGLMEALEDEFAPAGQNPRQFLDNFNKANTALGRLPTGEEVGAMAVWMASDAASAITGQCINVDCGVFPQ